MIKDADDAHRAGQRVSQEDAEDMPFNDSEGETSNTPPNNVGMPRRIGEVLRASVERMRKRARGEETPIPMPKGWEPLADKLHGGWWPEEQYILVSNTGQGKTQFALQAVMAAAKAGYPVLYVALEMNDTQIGARILGPEINAPWSGLYYGLNEGALADPRADEFVEAMGDSPFYIADIPGGSGWDYRHLDKQAEQIRRLHNNGKAMLIVIDFLQLVTSDDGSTLRERIKGAAYHCTHVARAYNASVLLLSSTARDSYRLLNERLRTDKDKGLAKIGGNESDASSFVGTGKESGEIEFSASYHMAMCQDQDGKPWIALGKVRAGVPAWIPGNFDKRFGVFSFSEHIDQHASKLQQQVRDNRRTHRNDDKNESTAEDALAIVKNIRMGGR